MLGLIFWVGRIFRETRYLSVVSNRDATGPEWGGKGMVWLQGRTLAMGWFDMAVAAGIK